MDFDFNIFPKTHLEVDWLFSFEILRNFRFSFGTTDCCDFRFSFGTEGYCRTAG